LTTVKKIKPSITLNKVCLIRPLELCVKQVPKVPYGSYAPILYIGRAYSYYCYSLRNCV